MKKNTLLTLDSGLVELAKARGINISGLVDNMLKSMLLSEGDPENILKTLEEMNNARYFGFSIQSLELKNVGPINNFSAKFPKGISMIIGPNSSGKSTIHRCISHILNYESHPSIFMENSEVELKINESEIKIKGENSNTVKLILLDDISRFIGEKIKKVIDYLNKAYDNPQIIINNCEKLDFLNCECFILKGKNEQDKENFKIKIEEIKNLHDKRYLIENEIKKLSVIKNNNPKKLQRLNKFKEELNCLQRYIMKNEMMLKTIEFEKKGDKK
ncbi:MAG: AAA family ATPase [Candidatus Nanoarchaeia archaeon]|nr:AAA family ATPase [Candidatus Nanoarchaeia archaeon]